MACSSWGFEPTKQSWELRDYSEESEGEGDDGLEGDLGSESEDGDEDMTTEECAETFFNMLVDLKHANYLSSKQVCLLSWWAEKGGLNKAGCHLAMSPASKTGAFQKKFDRTIGLDKQLHMDFYTIPTVVHQRYSFSRCSTDKEILLLHEEIQDEIERTEGFWGKVTSACSQAGWGPAYDAHPVVQAHGAERCVPIGIYLDGVKFQSRDSVTGVWGINLATHTRFLISALRKRELCRCGCKGWCSYFPVLDALRWQISEISEGRHPTTKHDGTAWPADSSRGAVAGVPLGWRCAVLFCKADWAEYSNSLGYRTWGHYSHPCFLCKCTAGPAGNWNILDDISVMGLPWELRTPETYSAACDELEHIIHIATGDDMTSVSSSLFYDKRKSGGFEGRAMRNDDARFNLKKGDRLEPSEFCRDVGQCENLSTPTYLKFWRKSANAECRHRNPLVAAGLGPQSMLVDELHTMHLGIFAVYVSHGLWTCIQDDVFGLFGLHNAETAKEISGDRIKQEMKSWCKAERKAHPDVPVYELQDFSLKTIGPESAPSLSAKAAETGTLVKFCHWFITKHKGKLTKGEHLFTAGAALVQYLTITRKAKPRLTPSEHQGIIASVVRFLGVRESAGLPWIPKCHLAVHLAFQCRFFGNPMYNGTWIDEGLNRDLSKVAASAHVLVWNRRVLSTMKHVLTRMKKRGREWE